MYIYIGTEPLTRLELFPEKWEFPCSDLSNCKHGFTAV